MTSLAQRQTLLSLIDEAVAAGARAARACQIMGLSLRTVALEIDPSSRRPTSRTHPAAGKPLQRAGASTDTVGAQQ